MSTSDVHRSGTADVTSSQHAPLWAIGVSILLIAPGFARRRSGDASPATGDRKPLETGRGRSAETPTARRGLAVPCGAPIMEVHQFSALAHWAASQAACSASKGFEL